MIHKIDLDNPQWCYVWDDGDEHKYKRIFVAELSNGKCMACDIDGDGCHWQHYELITEPKWRPFRDEKEFIEHCKTRTDMRILDKDGHMQTILVSAQGFKHLYDNYTWLDGSPIGVKE